MNPSFDISDKHKISEKDLKNILQVFFYTKRRKNGQALVTEEYPTRSDAMQREKYLKSGKGRDEMKRILGS